MQGIYNPPFGLPHIAARESHNRMSEEYHFVCLKCRFKQFDLKLDTKVISAVKSYNLQKTHLRQLVGKL